MKNKTPLLAALSILPESAVADSESVVSIVSVSPVADSGAFKRRQAEVVRRLLGLGADPEAGASASILVDFRSPLV